MKKILISFLIFFSGISLVIACSDGADYAGGDGSGGYESSVNGSDYYGGNGFDTTTNGGDNNYDNTTTSGGSDNSNWWDNPDDGGNSNVNVDGKLPDAPEGGIFDVVNEDIKNAFK